MKQGDYGIWPTPDSPRPMYHVFQIGPELPGPAYWYGRNPDRGSTGREIFDAECELIIARPEVT